MPPQHPQGDVLDRALAVARTQAPAKVPGQTGFFNALKPNSPLFAQTSRVNVDRPQAQRTQQQRVVPPPVTPPAAPAKPTRQQVEKKLFGAPSTLGGLAGDVVGGAKTLAHVAINNPEHVLAQTNPVLAVADATLNNRLASHVLGAANQETNKGLAALAKAQAGPSLNAQASTNSGLLNAFSKVPVASLSTADRAKALHAIAFFTANPSYHYDVPNLGLYNAKDKAAYKLPPTATDGDVVRAVGNAAGGLGHRNGFETALHNIPLNTVQMAAAPLGFAYLASQTAQGNIGALKEAAREQVDFGRNLIEHPIATTEKQPVTVATTLLGLGRAIGGVAGTAARTGIVGDAAKAFATPSPRLVSPAGYELKAPDGSVIPGKPINRGMTSPKLDERIAQAVSDKLASKSKAFGSRLDAKRANALTRGAHRFSDQLQTENIEPGLRAAAKLNSKEVRAVTYFHGQGFHTMGEASDYFTKQAADHRALEQAAKDHVANESHADWQARQLDLDNMAKIAQGLHRKLGDTPNEDMAAADVGLRQATRASENQLAGQSRQGTTLPLVSPETMLRRAYVPRARIDAELHGSHDAERFLRSTNDINDLHTKIQKAPETPLPTAATREITSIQENQRAMLTKQLRQLDQRIGRAQKLDKGVISPGMRPQMKEAPGSIRNLMAQRKAVADALDTVKSGDFTNVRIRKLEGLAQPTRSALEGQRDLATEDQMDALHQVRSQYRATRGAPTVELGAPLDEHDPLFFQHVVESPKGFMGIRRGQGLGATSENVAPRYGPGRLGKPGEQSTGALFAHGQASSDPSVYFGGLAKPLKVAAALKHFRSQVEDGIIAPKAGTRYDTSKYLDIAVKNATHTTEDADKAIGETTDQSLRDHIMAGVKDRKGAGPTAQIPDDGQEHYLITRHAAKNLENSFKGYDSKTLTAIRKMTGFWRWATLMARPAWLVNNVAGNTIQAAMGGAGLTSFARALRTGEGQKYEGTVPQGVENAGQFKNVFDRPSGISSTAMRPIHAFTRRVVDANVKYENFTRRALAISKGTREAKAAVHDELNTLGVGFHRTNEQVIEAMRNPSPESAARIVGHVNTWLGDFTKLRQTPILDVISPFHSWFTFIGKLTATMPVKTPGRALLLQRLGQLGINVQNQAFGGFVPNSMQGSIKLPGSLPFAGGLYKSTQGIFPFATPFQLLSPNDQSTTNPGQINPQAMLSALNPGFGALWNAGVGTDFQTGQQLKDQYGNPTGPANLRVLGHGLENAFPFATLASGYNTADTSLNPIHPQRTIPGLATQQPQSFADRAIGYGLGSVRPFDPVLNEESSFKRLKTAVIAEAKNKLKNG